MSRELSNQDFRNGSARFVAANRRRPPTLLLEKMDRVAKLLAR
jgi:hypothetical protein